MRSFFPRPGLPGGPCCAPGSARCPRPASLPRPSAASAPSDGRDRGRGKLFGNKKRKGGDGEAGAGRRTDLACVGGGGRSGGSHLEEEEEGIAPPLPPPPTSPVHRHVCLVRGNAPAFAFAISAVWWFKEIAVRPWPRGKTRPSRPSRSFTPFRFCKEYGFVYLSQQIKALPKS